jgi:hypothetical protein
MAKVIDRSGREWSFSIDVGHVRRVKQETGVNLGLPLLGEPPLVMSLNLDPFAMSEVLWSLMRPFAKDIPKMTEEIFYEIFTGDTFDQAKAAMFKELVDFFRRRNMTHVGETIEAALKMLPAMLAQAMEPIRILSSGPSSTNGPESSESTPAPSPCGNSAQWSEAGSTSKASAPAPLLG